MITGARGISKLVWILVVAGLSQADPLLTSISGPNGCSPAAGYLDLPFCSVPQEIPLGSFVPPGPGQSYADANFGGTVTTLTSPGWVHASAPWSAHNQYLFVRQPQSGTADVLSPATGETAYQNVPYGAALTVWDAYNDDVYYYISGAQVRKHVLSTAQDALLIDYGTDGHQFSSITAGGSTDSSKDNWLAFWVPRENQVCALDVTSLKTYCAGLATVPTARQTLGEAASSVLISRGVDTVTGKRYVLLLGSAAMNIWSVNLTGGRLDLEQNSTENAESSGKPAGICGSGETCLSAPPADVFEDYDGKQYLLTVNRSTTSCGLQLVTMALAAGQLISVPAEQGGGLTAVMLESACGQAAPSVQIGCAKDAPYCAVSTTRAALRDPSDLTSPFPLEPHRDGILVVRGNGQEVRTLAMSRSVLFAGDSLGAEPRAMISPDASLVTFNSNFGIPGNERANVVSTGFNGSVLLGETPHLSIKSIAALSPSTVTLTASEIQQFNLTCPAGRRKDSCQASLSTPQELTLPRSSASGSGVEWSITPNVGTIDQSGQYTAPASISSAQTITVTALDATLIATASINLVPTSVSVSLTPGSLTLGPNQSQQFTAGVKNSTAGVTWSLNPQVGTISLNGFYAAPSSISAVQTITLTATSITDPTKSASATITLMPPGASSLSVSVTPGSVTLGQSQTQQFSAAVTNSTAGVNWSLSPQVGTISSAGLYTAPSSISTAQTVTVTATSITNPGKSAFATISLTPPSPISVSVAPSSVTLGQSQMQQFTATVTNSTAGVNWSLSPQVGAISSVGLYTAPATIAAPQSVTVTATSITNPGKSASATISLTPPSPISVSVAPSSVTLNPSQTQQFSATVVNGSGVTWSLNPAVGTISSSGLYTAPSGIAAPQTVIVTATSTTNTTKSASASVTLQPASSANPNPPVSVSLAPPSVTLGQGQTQQFTATLTNATGGVTWSVTPAAGTVSSSGLYTAPSSIAAPQTVIVTATSTANTSASASASITLEPTATPVGAPTTASAPTITATPKGPTQINLQWGPVANAGYGYMVEMQSGMCGNAPCDSRYSSWTQVQPIPTASGYTCGATNPLIGSNQYSSSPYTIASPYDVLYLTAGGTTYPVHLTDGSQTVQQVVNTINAVSIPGLAASVSANNTVELSGAAVTVQGGAANTLGLCVSDPTGQHVYNLPLNGVPYWVVEPQYIDPVDNTPAQFIVHGLLPSTAYSFRVRTFSGYSSPSYGAYSNTATGITTTPAQTYYVSPSGSDTIGNGSSSQPWQTLYYASRQIGCGDLLYVESGTYTNDTINLTQNCSAGNRVVVATAPGASMNIISPTAYNDTVRLVGSYAVLDGIKSLAQVPTAADVVDIDGSYAAILGCEFGPSSVPLNQVIVSVGYGTNNLIYGSYLHDGGLDPGDNDNRGDNGWILALLYGTNNNVIWSNHLTRGGHDDSLAKGGYASGWLNNIMDGGWGQGWVNVYYASNYPLSGQNLIEGNINFHAGYMVSYYKPGFQFGQGHNTLRRNVVIGTQGAVEETTEYAGDNKVNLVYNNTFYTTWASGGNFGWCFFQSDYRTDYNPPTYGGSVFANNICYPLTSPGAGGFPGAQVLTGMSDSTQTFTHNDFLYVSGPTFSNGILTAGTPAPNQAIITYDGEGYNAATQQTDCGFPNGPCAYAVTVTSADTSPLALMSGNYNPPFSNNGIYSAVPSFVNVAGYDFHLTGNGGCGSDGLHCLVGGGTVITDSQFPVSSATWDIGAYGVPSTAGGALPDVIRGKSAKTPRKP
jgi:hypothetical protein